MSIGPIYGYTGNYNFTLIEYDFPRWQSYEHDNWRNLDATIATLFGAFGFGGIWKNNVTYNVNERIIDPYNNTLYLCLVDHTSIATGTFEVDRENNPTYWRSLSFNAMNRGNWAANTQYNVQDIVTSGSQIAICKLSHLSGTAFSSDVTAGYWSIIIDVSGFNIGLALVRANNFSDVQDPSAARANIGLGSIAVKSSTDYLLTANNLSDGNTSAIRTNLGIKSAASHPDTDFLQPANNLSDVTNAGNARKNIGLGDLSTRSTITVSLISDAGTVGASILKATNPNAATTQLSTFVGDSGTGGVKGLVPAPASGDATRFLNGSGGWSTPTFVLPSPPPLAFVCGLNMTTDASKVYVSVVSGSLQKTDSLSGYVISPNTGYVADTTKVGAGGVQSGTTLSAGFYAVYLIGNGTRVDAYIAPASAASGVPTMPDGYVYYKRIGWVRMKDATTLYLTAQNNTTTYYSEAPPVARTGVCGAINQDGSVVYGPYTVASTAAPKNVGGYIGYVVRTDTTATFYVNNRAGGSTPSGTQPPPCAIDPSSSMTTAQFDLLNIDGNLYLVCSDPNARLFISGWRDVI